MTRTAKQLNRSWFSASRSSCWDLLWMDLVNRPSLLCRLLLEEHRPQCQLATGDEYEAWTDVWVTRVRPSELPSLPSRSRRRHHGCAARAHSWSPSRCCPGGAHKLESAAHTGSGRWSWIASGTGQTGQGKIPARKWASVLQWCGRCGLRRSLAWNSERPHLPEGRLHIFAPPKG